ncbi:MAG TPA: zinc ribbon domain-containing protein [Nitrososphaerales archaeon]|nr:zinc ribbon domain-containing protein [Nitrososphaerales archaeon]
MACGTQLPDDASFCYRCGRPVPRRGVVGAGAPEKQKVIIAPFDAKSLKCPSCGAPIAPKFGEMVIMCEYCGTAITLGVGGWSSIKRHSMLPLKIMDKEVVLSTIRGLMNKGFLRRHLQEKSTLKEINLSYVPYWIISVSARTDIIAADVATQVGTVAATAAILGAMSGMGGGGHRHGGGGIVGGAVLGSVLAGGGQAANRKFYQMNENHNYPVIALRALFEYQPHDFEFALGERVLFETSKVPKNIKIFNGDVSEDDAKNQAKTLVEQLQSMKAHKKYHMIQQINTEIDIGDTELLHVPVWAARYEYKEKKMVLIIDGNSGLPIHSVGVEDESEEHLSLAS